MKLRTSISAFCSLRAVHVGEAEHFRFSRLSNAATSAIAPTGQIYRVPRAWTSRAVDSAGWNAGSRHPRTSPSRVNFIHHIQHVFSRRRSYLAGVQVGGDGVGNETLFQRRHSSARRGETAAAVSHVEDDAALAPLDHSRIEFAGFVDLVTQAGITVFACRYRQGRSFFVRRSPARGRSG